MKKTLRADVWFADSVEMRGKGGEKSVKLVFVSALWVCRGGVNGCIFALSKKAV